jgi:septal ring factor EnvC (AmiA/AmiB activator)
MQKRKRKQIPEEILRMILLEKLLRERKHPRRRPIVVEVGLDDEHLSKPDEEKHEKLEGELKQYIKGVQDDIKDLQDALKEKSETEHVNQKMKEQSKKLKELIGNKTKPLEDRMTSIENQMSSLGNKTDENTRSLNALSNKINNIFYKSLVMLFFAYILFPIIIVYIEHNEVPIVVLEKIAKAIVTIIRLVFLGLIG